MATKKVNIDIIARDKSKRALNNVRGSLDKLKASVFNVRNALAGVGAGLVIRNLVNTGKELENLQVRFKFLLKDANEGAKAFDNMVKFASKVPFSLEEIQSGSGILATVTDNADDLQKMLEITGNVAATTGLDFRTAAEQIQRSFSAGIGAADLFREKGVRNMLGFKAGATVSIEETVEAFERVFGKGGEFGSATDELANTFEGTLSMIGDKFFTFKKTILEAGFFPELKKQFKDLDTFLGENSKTLDELAVSLGKGLAQAVKFGADAIIMLKDNFGFLVESVKLLISFKIASVFVGIAGGITAANGAMLTFNATVKRNLFIAGAAIVISQFDKILEVLGKFDTDFQSFSAAIAHNNEQIKHYKNELGLAEAQLKLLINQYGENTKIEEFSKQIEDQKEIIKNAKEKIKLFTEENDALFKEGYPVYEDNIMRIAKALKSETEEIENGTEAIIKRNEKLDEFLDKELQKKMMMEDASLFDTPHDQTQEEQNALEKSISQYKLFAHTMKQLRNDEANQEIENEKTKAENVEKILLENQLEGMRIHHDMTQEKIRLNNIEVEAEQKKQDELVALKKQGNKEMFDNTRSGLQAISGLNKTAFEAFKRFQIAEATINAIRSASKAFGQFPFPINIGVAATALAKGMALVAQIKSTSFREKGGPVSQGKPFIVGEKGPELFVPNQSGNIVANNKMGGSPVAVTFNINTVDARGFNELLTNSRGTIVSLINSAVNETGRQAVV